MTIYLRSVCQLRIGQIKDKIIYLLVRRQKLDSGKLHTHIFYLLYISYMKVYPSEGMSTNRMVDFMLSKRTLIGYPFM